MKKRIIIALSVVALLVIALTLTLVMSHHGRLSASTRHYDKTITAPDGKTVELEFSETEDMQNGKIAEKYLDPEGNTYYFNEDGMNTSYSVDQGKRSANVSLYRDEGRVPMDEESALEIAYADLLEKYGEYFKDMTLVNAFVSDFDGSWNIHYAQLLGEGDFIEGIACQETILVDGTIGSSALVGVPEFEGIGDEQVEGITYDMISRDVENTSIAKYGESYLSYDIGRIWLRNENGRVVVAAIAHASFLSEEGKEIVEELPLFTYELND